MSEKTITTNQPIAKCEKCGCLFLTFTEGNTDKYAPQGIYMAQYKEAGTAPTCGGKIVRI